MNKIPPKLRSELAADPYYKLCARRGLFGHECGGKITWEHAMYYAGKQIQARWAIIPICARGHAVNEYQDRGEMDKQVHEWIALNRATDEELRAISKVVDYIHSRSYLNSKFGSVYKEKII